MIIRLRYRIVQVAVVAELFFCRFLRNIESTLTLVVHAQTMTEAAQKDEKGLNCIVEAQ